MPPLELNGQNLRANGVAITDGKTIRGLMIINRFAGAGISIAMKGGSTIETNYIGVDVMDRSRSEIRAAVSRTPQRTT